MRAPISVIIPTLNAGAGLPATLAALAPGLEAGLIRELVISDGGSRDGTRAIADAAGATWVAGPASRGGQLRRGAEVAQGRWLLFLHADTVLGRDWAEAVLPVLGDGGAWHFRLAFDEAGFAPGFVAGWANLRSSLLGLPYGDQGLLIDRDSYAAAGGFADIPLMEDVAIARALKGTLKGLPVVATTSAARYRRAGWLRRGARNLSVLLRYLAGADPVHLARIYRR